MNGAGGARPATVLQPEQSTLVRQVEMGALGFAGVIVAFVVFVAAARSLDALYLAGRDVTKGARIGDKVLFLDNQYSRCEWTAFESERWKRDRGGDDCRYLMLKDLVERVRIERRSWTEVVSLLGEPEAPRIQGEFVTYSYMIGLTDFGFLPDIRILEFVVDQKRDKVTGMRAYSI